MTSNQPAVAAKQEVVNAAERAAQLAGGDQRYVKLTEVALKTVGLELARHMQPGQVATATRDRGRLSPHQDAITFVADGARYEFVLPSKIAEGRLTFMVNGVLSGAVSFGQASDVG
jgi:hypothetical protein